MKKLKQGDFVNIRLSKITLLKLGFSEPFKKYELVKIFDSKDKRIIIEVKEIK